MDDALPNQINGAIRPSYFFGGGPVEVRRVGKELRIYLRKPEVSKNAPKTLLAFYATGQFGVRKLN